MRPPQPPTTGRPTLAAYVHASEAAISAAAEALVWSTADAQGVLAHVATADSWIMAGTRLVYERETKHLDPAAAASVRDFANLREIYRTTDSLFDVAALPRTVAPE